MNDELEKYRKMHSDIKRLYKPERKLQNSILTTKK